MKDGWISRVFPFSQKYDTSLSVKDRYVHLKRNFLIVMLVVTMVPLVVVTGLSYFKYRSLIETETVNNALWNADGTRRTIEAFVGRLTAAVLAISDSYTFDELAGQETIDKVFERLKAEHKGLVDLSVIGPEGIQRSYSGPFDLAGKDYSDSEWYQKALARKVYVSEVFLGYRNIPHFVIAVSKKLNGRQQYWVLRASIDMDTLNQFLSRVGTENLIDIFLVDGEGKLQSSSRNHGNKIDQSVVVEDLPRSENVSIGERRVNNQTVLKVIGQVRDTPWFLVIDEYSYTNKRSWLVFKRELAAIFLISVAVMALAIIPITSMLANTIRKAEESREAVLVESEHANKLASIGRLAAGVAHEINNPLAIINEKTGLMKDIIERSGDFAHREKFITQMDSIANAVKRSRAIIHRLLGFARRMEARMEPVQVNTVIGEVLGFLEKEASYRDIRIEQNLAADLPSIMGDHGQMQQIVLNIVNNAIDAVKEAGTITISTSSLDNGSVRITIADDGPGMAPEVMRNIFEPFFTTKHDNDRYGTGLGLSITYGLVKKLGGEISVRSDVGVGASFDITLPIAPAIEGIVNE